MTLSLRTGLRRSRFALALSLLSAVPLAAQTTSATPASTGPEDAPNWLIPVQDLNTDLPSWIQFNGQVRDRVERSGGIKYTKVADLYNLTQLRLQLILQPLRWMKFVGETQDVRVFYNGKPIATAPPYQNRFDIRQAYADFGDATDGLFNISVGREMLSFGDERVIGPSDWLNQGRTFDTVRLDLHHPGYNINIFASSVVLARDGVIDHHLEGDDLHGIYSSFNRLVRKATFEPYVLWHLTPDLKLSENQGKGKLNEVTFAFRLAGKLPASFDYNVEMDKQTGSLGPYSIDAWAGHWKAGRNFTWSSAVLHPFIEANYASGTKNPSGSTWGTFDQIYPSSHDKLDFADQIGWRNIEQVRTGVEEKFGRNWSVKQTYESFWLASRRDGLYTASGALVVSSPTGSAGSHVGQEIDAVAEYRWNTAIELGFGYACLFPGQFLDRTTPGRDYTYPYFYTTYHFTHTEDH